MSKAEERALEVYPPKMRYVCIDLVKYDRKIDINKPMRDRYVKAYHQAEKDLELTWEDIELIVNIDKDTDNEESITGVRKNEEHYEEVLKRFKEIKEK